MTTVLVLLAVLAILAMLGAAVTFTWLGAKVGGAVVRMLMPTADSSNADMRSEEISRLIRRTRRASGLPPIN